MPFDDENSPIDLENIDYDDVLHLYRGWRRAETALKERTLECEALKSRTEKFEDNHERFRNQIQALESVKDLTINLQSQLNMVQSENVYLTNENRRYIEIQQKMDRELKEEKSHNYRQQLEDARKEMDFHKQKYQEMVLSHKALETMVANESAARQSAENRLSSLDEVTEALRAENSTLRLKMDNTLVRMNQCDHEIAHAAEQLSKMAKELAQANEAHELMLTAEAEVGVLKGDIARLIRLMEHYPASHEFLDRWFDSDGLDFMGMGEPSSTHPSDHPSNSSMITAHNPHGHSYSTSVGQSDYPGGYGDREYSNYNNNHDEDEYDHRRPDPDITPSEYAQLKRIYGGDPFPMTKDFAEEQDLWVPRQAAREGLMFLVSKIPHAPPKLITEFLRKINKVWLRREQRKINQLKSAYEREINDYKRRLSYNTPYRGVMADHQIRRLKQQVREDLTKSLSGRPRRATDVDSRLDRDYFDETDDVSSHDQPHKGGNQRLCEQIAMGNRKGGGSVVHVSKEKLLEASLLSLETLGRQRHHPSLEGSAHLDSLNALEREREREREAQEAHPTEAYLRGALWLGRNLTMVIEELAEGLDHYRTKHNAEVHSATSDPDLKRSQHRLSLLASACANEALTLTNRTRVRAREILQGTASIAAGDIVTFQDLLRTLPIESSLTQPSTTQQPSQSSSNSHAHANHKPHTSVLDTTNAMTGRGNITTITSSSRGGGGGTPSVSTRNSINRPNSAPPRRNSTGANYNSSVKARF